MGRRTQSGPCQTCGVWRYSLHRDHIVPKFRGGGEEPENIQLLCANCHEDKTRQDMMRELPPEHRAKISAALKGRKMNEAARQAMIGRRLSPEHCESISRALKGSKLSEAHRRSLSEAHRGKKRTPEQRAKMSEAMKRVRADQRAAKLAEERQP